MQVGGDHFLRNNRHLAGTKVGREVDAPNVVHLVDDEEEEDERIFQQNKRPRRDNGEFSQDVLQSARLYIKSVSEVHVVFSRSIVRSPHRLRRHIPLKCECRELTENGGKWWKMMEFWRICRHRIDCRGDLLWNIDSDEKGAMVKLRMFSF